MQDAKKIVSVFIEDEMQKSYLDYSMSMITSRALPDVRDGLKPVHRRVLYGMEDLGLRHNKPTKKCANVVGNVMAKYHPHGDSAIYDTLVRMAQEFSMRYPMVDGQGNFGSIDGDPPAAYRYTECRMQSLAELMLEDIEKETVNFVPNYDDTSEEPSVLPARLPYLLLNGSTGIAVGMATNMAPHNLREVVNATVAMIENPEIDYPELLKLIPGPDFPTGGIIYGRSGILEAYKNGKGKAVVRARAEVEKLKNDREQIIITEIPYMVNKGTLLEKMGDLVRQKVVEGISFLRDESDRRGLRIVIGVKKDAYGEVVLNKLYKYTQLQSTFGINNLALVNQRPRLLNLRQILQYFIDHRFEVVTRRTQYDLRKAKERAHILEGLRIAIDNIDEIVELIKTSSSPEDARVKLIDRFSLSEIQAREILNMRLQRLTGLERDKIEEEYKALLLTIEDLESILASREKRMNIIKDELFEIQKKYGDERRTEIVDAASDVDIEDMIADEDMVITMSHAGYIKRCAATVYRAQGRGGRGIKGMDAKDDDFIDTMFVASAHSNILFFTNTGRCYSIKVYRIPEAGRQSKGRPIINVIEMRGDEKIASYVSVKEFNDESFVVVATQNGIINKQPLKAYAKVRRDGVNAINLDPGDKVIACKLTNGDNDILLGTASGQAVRFHESAIRELGRNTRGVKGITLRNNDTVVGMVIAIESDKILSVTENGYGKKTLVDEYRKTNRGGTGIINIKCTDRNGPVVSLKGIGDGGFDLMLITRNGIIIRCDADGISTIGRNTQGVRLINLDKDDKVIDCTIVEREKESEIDTDEAQTPETETTSEALTDANSEPEEPLETASEGDDESAEEDSSGDAESEE